MTFKPIPSWFKSLLWWVNRKPDLKKLLKQIMATQTEIVQELTAVKATLVKVGTETSTLLKRIADLQAVIDAGAVTPELEAAAKAVADQAKVVDDLVPDAPTPPAA